MRVGLTDLQLIRCAISSASPFLLKIESRSFSFIFTKKMDWLFSKFASRDVLALSEGVSISVMMWALWGDWISLPFLRSMGTRWWAVLFLVILRYLSASSIFITLACLRSNLPSGVRQSPAGCTLAFLGDPRCVLLKGRAAVAAVCVSLTSMGTQSESMFLLGSPSLLARFSWSLGRGLYCGRVRSGKHPIQCVIKAIAPQPIPHLAGSPHPHPPEYGSVRFQLESQTCAYVLMCDI